ncbi:MAG: hypothetical protein APR63_12430 [Desulfuromonas sp. SDB]|nr:MAG: hypothetical protein APR54_04380 [Candidatus Cloacimonas sp. SDB]KQC15231.1 MAG: hypothetical protein APR63_12430 [Desulfuromonas sp. SDB]
MIDSGEVRNQAELAKKLGISRARVTQILNLLKLDPLLIKELENLGDPMDKEVVTEKKLRGMIRHSLKYIKNIHCQSSE